MIVASSWALPVFCLAYKWVDCWLPCRLDPGFLSFGCTVLRCSFKSELF